MEDYRCGHSSGFAPDSLFKSHTRLTPFWGTNLGKIILIEKINKNILFFNKFLYLCRNKTYFSLMIIEWWNSLDLANKILWAVTLSASLVFVIQTVMTFLGAAGDSDFDINTDADASAPGDLADGSVDVGGGPDAAETSHLGSGMNLLTFRNFINFLIGFGWTAILLEKSIPATGLRMLIAIVVGLILVVLVMLLFKWLTDMQQSGNINVYKSAVGCEGTVYLTIPGERAGEGKIQITISNAVREYAAVTDGPTLKTGVRIRVVEVVSANTMLVEEINSVII